MPTGVLLELGAKGEPNYEMQLIKGANEGKFNAADGRFIEKTENGFGLTMVSSSFWDRWAAKNKAIVAEWKRNRVVDAFDSRDEADMFRTANGDVRTGFEPFDPAKMPKGLEASDRPSPIPQ
jgi:hypothetical protein